MVAAGTDEKCHAFTGHIQKVFPNSRHELAPALRKFWPMTDDLYCLDKVPIKNNKILIPRQFRPEILKAIHSAHQGVNKMLVNARQRLFWLGLGASVR